MTTKTKFQSKPVWWNTNTQSVINKHDVEIWRCNGKLRTPPHYTRFDSQHEFKVYLELVRMYGTDRVVRQHKIQVIPSGICYPNGKTWRVDFAIRGKHVASEFLAYVEAKGAFLSEFGYTLSLLECNLPVEFQKLRIVFTGKPPVKHRIIQAISKTSLAKMLISFNQLQTANHLS